MRQLLGAKRKLFDLNKPIELENPRRGKELFDPKTVKEVYLISALVGEGEDYFEFVKKIKDKTIHTLDRESTEIFLNELDTISDFVSYLREKESFLNSKTQITLAGGEEELLAYYLINGRSFNDFKRYSLAVIEEGCWRDLIKKPEYLAKKKEDRVSYFWDFLIDKAHLSKDKQYEVIAREMARLNRFQRRLNSKMFFEGHSKADKSGNKNFYKRIMLGDGITYCFLYADAPNREDRKNLLGSVCIATRDHYRQNRRVLGIATEFKIAPRHSYEFCLLDFPEWTETEEKHAKEVKEQLGISKNQKMSRYSEDEYPIER